MASRRRGCSPHDPLGFTLLEILVVLTVIGVVLAIAAPSVPRSSAADDAARALGRVLESAREHAALRAVNVAVEIEPGSARYRMVRIDPGGADSLLVEGSLASPRVHLEDGDSGSVGGAGVLRIRFSPLGRADGGPVEVQDGRGDRRIVRVDPWSGRSDVEVP
ncbi:MAG TPA: GspH/FimT family pseudopilin [Longimicrobiaceae bacterium]|jgi:prepilin-type N-terminal cleavage/methylation domain-containing protein|nr:GspH/FimT family pseudopilin [Longimicrobiaceae bacterium]